MCLEKLTAVLRLDPLLSQRHYLSEFRLARLLDWPGSALALQTLQTSNLPNPPSLPSHGQLSAFLSCSLVPSQTPERLANPGQAHLIYTCEVTRSLHDPPRWRLVRMRHGRQQAAGGYHPSFDFFPLPGQPATVELFISCPTYDAMSEWVSLADSFCGILPSRCPKDLTPGLLPSSPS